MCCPEYGRPCNRGVTHNINVAFPARAQRSDSEWICLLKRQCVLLDKPQPYQRPNFQSDSSRQVGIMPTGEACECSQTGLKICIPQLTIIEIATTAYCRCHKCHNVWHICYLIPVVMHIFFFLPIVCSMRYYLMTTWCGCQCEGNLHTLDFRKQCSGLPQTSSLVVAQDSQYGYLPFILHFVTIQLYVHSLYGEDTGNIQSSNEAFCDVSRSIR